MLSRPAPRPAALKAPRTRICCRLTDLLPLALEAARRQRDAVITATT